MYLIAHKDYEKLLYQEDRYILTYNDEPTVLENAEAIAVEQVKAYLRAYRFGRFDFDSIFIQINEYNNNNPYEVGQVVWANVLMPSGTAEFGIYTCVQDNRGKALTDTDFWTLGDPRNQLLIMYMADIVIYHLFAHITPNMIPDIRTDRYKQALDWLSKIRDGKIDADLAIITPEIDRNVLEIQAAHTNGKRNIYRF